MSKLHPCRQWHMICKPADISLLTLQGSLGYKCMTMRQAPARKQLSEYLPSIGLSSMSPQLSSALIESENPPHSAALGKQAHKKAKHVPRRFISLNEHSIPSQYKQLDHHLEGSGFTKELGLLPSCKRRRTACAQAYLTSQKTDASADVPNPQQGSRPSSQSTALPPTSSSTPMVTSAAAEAEARGADDTRPCTVTADERGMGSLKDGKSSNAVEQAAGRCFTTSDAVSQNDSDRSSSDRLHLPDGREQRVKQRAAKQQQAGMQLQELYMAPAGRLSKRKGKPHRSAYC